MNKKKLVVFSGAGMSAESGISTFRDSGGLWEKYKIEEVATFGAWQKNPDLVLDFYNQRRKQIMEVQPNLAHELVARLQDYYDVQVITQNIDNLHERAGSKKVLHLHGEIMKVRSTQDDSLVYELDVWELKKGDVCEKGFQLRPHIVWFGELVPEMDTASILSENADVFLTVGTSLNVYPAANLMNVVPSKTQKYLIDPGDFRLEHVDNLTIIKNTAVKGMQTLFEKLTSEFK
jgi:NAD-dependent deacetylase